MRLNYWMIAKAVVVIVFGIGFILVPGVLGTLFGMNLTPAGTLLGQLFGTAFIFEGIVLWFSRNLTRSDVAMQGILLAVVVSNVIGFVATLLATLSNVWNVLGWLPVLLYLVFAVAFAYFKWVMPVAAGAHQQPAG